MRHGNQVLPILLAGAALAGGGCKRSPARFANDVAKICPAGWQVAVSNEVIVIRREAPVWIMGKVNPPSSIPGESDESFFKREGTKVEYELRLRFVPRLGQAEYEKLRAARADATVKLDLGAPGITEYTRLQQQFENCQAPVFFTEDYSIFVERWEASDASRGHLLEPRFMSIYPPVAAAEAEAIIENLKKVFTPYPAAVPEKR